MVKRAAATAGAALALAMVGLLCVTCARVSIKEKPIAVSGPWADGTYEGEARILPNKARVKVTVEGGRIADVQVLSHFASWIGKKAEKGIPGRIIAAQSTRVDAVTGATNSSRVLMAAVEDAVGKARVAAPQRRGLSDTQGPQCQ
ncbi:MAG TPA: FMN-binding protein [Sumerlaeia bacterium]|nr:FMN-binding protein [Sumerlaeia bacterium]